MSKNTDTIRKLGAIIKAEPERADDNTGFILGYCADEIDRLRGELDHVRVGIARALPFLRQACKTAHEANDPENFEV